MEGVGLSVKKTEGRMVFIDLSKVAILPLWVIEDCQHNFITGIKTLLVLFLLVIVVIVENNFNFQILPCPWCWIYYEQNNCYVQYKFPGERNYFIENNPYTIYPFMWQYLCFVQVNNVYKIFVEYKCKEAIACGGRMSNLTHHLASLEHCFSNPKIDGNVITR